MFDIGATEFLLVVIVAILVIGPKDMPLALRTAGRWIGKVRRVSGHFKAGVESMIREAELDEMDKKWKEQNEAIMAAHPKDGAQDEAGEQMQPLDKNINKSEAGAESRAVPQLKTDAPALAKSEIKSEAKPSANPAAKPAGNPVAKPATEATPMTKSDDAEPGLPFGSPQKPR